MVVRRVSLRPLGPLLLIWSLTGDNRDLHTVFLSQTSPPPVLVRLVDRGVPDQPPRRSQGPRLTKERLGIRFRQLPLRGRNHGAVRDPSLVERRLLCGGNLLARSGGVALLV